MTSAAAIFDLTQEKWKPVGWKQPGEGDHADPFLSGAAHSYTR